MGRMMENGRWGVIILTAVSLTYFTENFLRSAPSALTPVLMGELGLSYVMAGLLISSYFFVYAVMQLPAGILSDRFGPRRTIIGFTIFTVLGALLFYIASGLELLLAGQLLMGLGSSVFYINAVQIVSRWFPRDRQASAIGILSATSGLGNFAAYIGFPLASTYLGGWRPLYLLCSLLMATGFVANLLVLRDQPQQKESNPGREAASLWASLKKVFGEKRIYPIMAGYILICCNWVFLSWLPQFLTDAKGFQYIDAGLVSSAATIMGIPGCILIGVVSDRLRRRKLPLIAFSAAAALLLILFLALPSGAPTLLFAVVAGALGFAYSQWVLFISMIPEALPPETAGIALGLLNGIGTLGFSLLTPVYGRLVDLTGGYRASNGIILVAGVLATLILFLFTEETYGGEQSGRIP
jgi:predicted MFS family arabinose efflux permease